MLGCFVSQVDLVSLLDGSVCLKGMNEGKLCTEGSFPVLLHKADYIIKWGIIAEERLGIDVVIDWISRRSQ